MSILLIFDQLAQSRVSQGIDKFVTGLNQGRLKLKQKIVNISPNKSVIERKSQRKSLEKELVVIDSIFKAQKAAYQKSKTERIKEQKERKTQQEEKIKSEISKKIQRWRQQRKIQQMRKNMFQKKQHQKMQEQKRREEVDRQKAYLSVGQAKKRQYQKAMKEIQARKQERLRQLSNKIPRKTASEAKIPPINFIIKYPNQPQQSTSKLSFQDIKVHEKKFMEKIRQRPSKSIEQLFAKHYDKFNLGFNRPEKTILEEQLKVKKRIQFDLKVKQMPLQTVPQRQIERQIQIDKEKQPVKYLVLGRKGLSDQQIFQSPADPIPDVKKMRDVGNSYLQELRSQTSHKAKSNKSPSIQSEQITTQTARPPRYINYLSSLSTRKLTDNERLILQAKNSPSHLLHESNKYQEQALHQIKRLSKIQDEKAYKQLIQTESKIDDLFLKAIKARIACISVSK